MVVKIEEKVVITHSSEAKNLNENEYFTAYFNDVKYGMTDYYEDLDGNEGNPDKGLHIGRIRKILPVRATNRRRARPQMA